MEKISKNAVTSKVRYSDHNIFMSHPSHRLSVSELPLHSHSQFPYYTHNINSIADDNLTLIDSNGNSYSCNVSSIIKHVKFEVDLKYKPRKCYE